MFKPSRWFGWNRPGTDSGGGGNGSGGGDGNGSPMSRSSSQISIPHSLEHLKTLYNLLEKNQNVTEQNRTLLVETLRQISEILIWGDQNDSTVFDFFLEKNMLYFFLKIMKQKCGGFVCTQLLQTLNILFENIRNETSLYYLLSNNHVNSIIVHKFDFDDEEVMAYYISFLKTLSLKLNGHTVHFFFNEHTADFPLYTEAIKFFNHSEKMVRIAVRTLTLNVFRVRDNAMLRFIRDCTAAPYFSNLSWFIGNHVLDIEGSLTAYIENKHSNGTNIYSGQNLLMRLEDLIAEHLDHLHYLNDILLLNIDDLNTVLADNLLHRLIIPLYLHSFLCVLNVKQAIVGPDSDESAQPIEAKLKATLSPNVALFLLTQAHIIFSYGPLLNTLVNFLLRSSRIDIELNSKRCEFTPPNSTLEAAISQAISTTVNSTNKESSESVGGSEESTPSEGTKALFHGPDTNNSSSDSTQSNAPNVQTLPSQSMEEFKRLYFGHHQNHVAEINHNTVMPMETDTFPVQVMTIRNWPEFPFLIAMLSALNANITSSSSSASSSASTPLEAAPSSSSRLSVRNTTQPSDSSDTLTKSCHSPTVTRSLVELAYPDDRITLFTLSLLVSILSNKAIDCSYYRGLLVPPSSESSPLDSESTNSYCSALINSLLLIMRNCCSTNSSIRIVTFELAVYLFKRIVFYYHYLELTQSPQPKHLPIFLSDHQLAVLEQANEDASHILRQYFCSTDQTIFLELFEQEAEVAAAAIANDEKDHLARRRPGRIWSHNLSLNLEQLFMDSTLMLPSEEISPTSFDSNFYLRLPMNEYERTRYVFFILRRLSMEVRGGSSSATEATENMLLPEKQTDFLSMLLDSTETSSIALDQFLDLENSDLNSCSIRFFYPLNQSRVLSDPRRGKYPNHASAPGSRSHSPSISVSSRKISRFMVITAEHVILIEPDTKHYGWGVIRFIARLQDLEFWSHAHAINQPTQPQMPRKEKDDYQSIYVYFRRYQMSSSMSDSNFSRSQPGSIVIRFSFDDQIRCYAAKQHLTKAQSKVHDRKISAIVKLIDLNSNETSTESSARVEARAGKATTSKSGDQLASSRKKPNNSHPLLSRSLAVPGGAVLSMMTIPTDPGLANSSASAKFDMLNKTKYAYPSATKIGKSAKSATPDSEAKKKKKLKNPKELPDAEDSGIPLNDLSPKTTRRATISAEQAENGNGKGEISSSSPAQVSQAATSPSDSSNNSITSSTSRSKTLTETIDI